MTTQGAAGKTRKPRTTHRPTVQPVMTGVDLDAKLAAVLLLPEPVNFKGKTYMVRTDLTSPEVTLYLKLAEAGKELEGYQLLMGESAGDFMAALHTVPRLHQRIASREVLVASKALADFAMSEEDILGGKPGES